MEIYNVDEKEVNYGMNNLNTLKKLLLRVYYYYVKLLHNLFNSCHSNDMLWLSLRF